MHGKTVSVLFAGAAAIALCYWTGELLGQRQSLPAQSQQDTLWIASVPAGLKVYLVPDSETAADKKEENDRVPLVEKHSVVEERNFKGVTPLTLRVASGKYLVAVAPVMLLDKNYQTGQVDPILRPRAMVAFESPKDPKSFQDGLTGAVIYPVEKLNGITQKLVLLAQGSDATLDTLEATYPTGNNFSFDNDFVSKKLIEANIPQGDLSRVLSLLHRGGKLMLVRGDIRWGIEVSNDGTPTIKTQIRGK